MVLRCQLLNRFNQISQTVFCDTRKCLFRRWTNILWSPTRIYLRTATFPDIYKWLTTGIKRNWVIPLCWRYLYLKTKTVLLSWMRSPPKLSILCRDYSLTQHNTVGYFGWYLVPRRVLKKINTKLNFLWRQSNYLNYSSRRLLCNALIQPHFDYGWSSWYPLLSKALKTK